MPEEDLEGTAHLDVSHFPTIETAVLSGTSYMLASVQAPASRLVRRVRLPASELPPMIRGLKSNIGVGGATICDLYGRLRDLIHRETSSG